MNAGPHVETTCHRPPLPDLALRLAASLHGRGVTFTHWKSNCRLGEPDGHEVEFDLLVDPVERGTLQAVLADLGFRKVVSFTPTYVPDVYHYYGIESEGNLLVHVHVYHRVITGESLLKNYELPLLVPLLAQGQQVSGFPVPPPALELRVFTARVMLKHASLVERRLLYRDYESVREEMIALTDAAGVGSGESAAAPSKDLPELDEQMVRQAIDAVTREVPTRTRTAIARRFRRALKPYRRFGRVSGSVITAREVLRRMTRRMLRGSAARGLSSGGRVIAFVGAEASGKSTLVRSTATFYSKAFAVGTVHFGKPPATVWTAGFRLVIPTLRKIVPGARPTRVEAGEPDVRGGHEAGRPGLGVVLYAVRSVMLARERRILARRVFARSSRGEVILCDRYPSRVVGAADSPRLTRSGATGWGGRLYNALVLRERKIYEMISPPDAVIRLTVPIEDAVKRNAERIKAGKEDEEYVRQRHARAELLSYPGSVELQLDTAGDFNDTLRLARQRVWRALSDDV